MPESSWCGWGIDPPTPDLVQLKATGGAPASHNPEPIMTATTAATITADQMDLLGHQVSSSAMVSWALVQTDNGTPELLVLFRQGGTVYRYAFRSWEDAQDWDALRDEDAVSWGGALHRFMKDGALLPIAA